MKLYTKGLVRRVLGPSVSVMKYDEVSSSSFSNSKDSDLILAPFQSPLQWILMVYYILHVMDNRSEIVFNLDALLCRL